MLYEIEANKHSILNNTYYLLGICIVLLLVRVSWKYFEAYVSRGFEKDIKIKLFERFLKLKLKDIQNIKNGEIIEQGSHNELVNIPDGYYSKLYNAYYTNLVV